MDCPKHSMFHGAPDIRPLHIDPRADVADFLDLVGATCFEARNVLRAGRLWQRSLDDGDMVWLGIAGAGIAGGLGGVVVQLIRAGFVDAICTTGAQAYHDLHFAFGLPVKAISPMADDDELALHGDTRIYDIGIREQETLGAQDRIIRKAVAEIWPMGSEDPLSSAEFMLHLGNWVLDNAPNPKRSFVAAAARAGVPVFWDSPSNHSIAMNLARLEVEGLQIPISASQDILLSAAVAYGSASIAFVELGGGGPKNFIQQTGPTIHQILGIDDYPGASRGIQISTANEREGSLSGCTFGEAVTWGKYESADAERLVQVWGEYSLLFPLLAAYVLRRCGDRPQRRILDSRDELMDALLSKALG
jgi:deoxyhypusine synthase